MAGSSAAEDINLIASFLAHEQIRDLSQAPPVDCVVLCGSAILHCAQTVFSALQARPDLTKTLVICGGIGHSTRYLYDAIAQDPKQAGVAPEIQGLPESHVLHKILERSYDGTGIVRAGCRIIIEDTSTNCGANAIETRRILEAHNIPKPRSCVIVQDPTMSIRTLAAFRKTYSDLSSPPTFVACPSFVPRVQVIDGKLEYVMERVASNGLWGMGRFCDLLLGEIPRLRDDAEGYGPKGRGFIDRVGVPEEVEKAWGRLQGVMAGGRTRLAN